MTDEPGPEPLLLQLLRAVQIIEERMTPLFGELGVSAEQWRVLAVLAHGEGHTMTDLARLSVLPPATTTRTIDKLIASALVYRRVDPLDRRRVMVFLSPHGARALAAVSDRQEGIERELAAIVGVRRFLALNDGLTHLTQ
ncbi:MarR family winged helix-turn-helix transcriptional regulator [Gordonia hankookensis]|uniref:MarR family transcriptional regulator n=1 Tax=Gordonia hankookensis TaxID=589403 RepID=A0ABR7WFG6_9ACTN|nr:MarR family transcriptional regulator [Gordonia hankookensis]MBD1321521.1 MarR family transcriptional regulator [Gordonia hankookensis]